MRHIIGEEASESLDLNSHLITHPAATFFMRAEGDGFVGEGVAPGDLLIVDRSLPPSKGRVVVAVVDGELVLKRVASPGGSNLGFQVWGVVTYVIHKVV